MRIRPSACQIDPQHCESGLKLQLVLASGAPAEDFLFETKAFAYAPFINAHDHLIGNWVPRSGEHHPYANSHIWVREMKDSFAVQERSGIWSNDGTGNYTDPNAYLLAQLGCYKNLFSGCGYVADHGPVQPDAYYDGFPLTVLRNYRQCHSITMGNWWGGLTPEEEMALTKGKAPFIIHLAEGDDAITKKEFAAIKKRGLLQPNTLIIHGIALTPANLKEVVLAGASICWCPASNLYLIGKTLDIKTALKFGLNPALGTDSTQTGSVNLLDEFAQAHLKFPEIPLPALYKMITVNAAKALLLPPEVAVLDPDRTSDLLLIDAIESDPLGNLPEVSSEHIQLFLHKGKPLYGDAEWLDRLHPAEGEFTEFRVGKREKFVAGDPLELNDRVDAALGYHKDFPYLPF